MLDNEELTRKKRETYREEVVKQTTVTAAGAFRSLVNCLAGRNTDGYASNHKLTSGAHSDRLPVIGNESPAQIQIDPDVTQKRGVLPNQCTNHACGGRHRRDPHPQILCQ